MTKYVNDNPVIFRRRFKDNIPGFPGYYASKRGRIFTRKRVGMGRKSRNGIGDMNTKHFWRELTYMISNKGYKRLVLQDKNHNRHYVQVSRLVALAWIPNPENKPFVCHKDNNPLNNTYKNLYWGTQSENILQCVKEGRHCNGRYNLNWRKRYGD